MKKLMKRKSGNFVGLTLNKKLSKFLNTFFYLLQKHHVHYECDDENGNGE